MKIQRQRDTFAYRIEAADRSQTINPVPRTKVRPDLYWERTEPQQDTLPLDVPDTIDVKSRTRKEKDNSVPLDRKPQVLWRGVNLDLGHPGAQRIMRTLLGETHNEDTSGYLPGMPSDDDIVETWDNYDYTNQNLGEMILDHAATAYPGQGLGRHWTPLVNEAKEWANDVNFLEGEPLSVLFKSEWMGQGEDTNRNYTMGDWPDELEVTQRPGAPHRITQVYIQHPQTSKWHPVLRDPQDRTAMVRKAADDQPRPYDVVDRLKGEFTDQRQQETFALRIARLAAKGEDLYVSGLIDRLDGEFNDFVLRKRLHNPYKDSPDEIGPIGNWANVEYFLKENYPAAHKGHDNGMEEAGLALDDLKPMPYQQYGNADLTPYDTGSEAVAQHGYDPKEVAAAMLLLHSKSHPYRGQDDQWMMADLDRLYSIYRTRQKQQQTYDEKNAKPEGPVLRNPDPAYIDMMEKFDPEMARQMRENPVPISEDGSRVLYPDEVGKAAHRTATVATLLRLAANDDLGIDDLHEVFRDYVSKAQPIDPKTKRPHTPESAIRDWPSGVAPFIQAVRPDLPFERYKYEPHTRGLDEYQDAPSLVAKLVALHTREKYGVETMYRRQKEADELARNLLRDQDAQAAKGQGFRSDGTFGPMPVFMGNGPRPDGSFGPKYVYRMPDGTKTWHFPDKAFPNGQLPPPPPPNQPLAPGPTIQPQQTPMQPMGQPQMQPQPNPMMQPRNPMAQPTNTTPRPTPMPQPNPMPMQPPMSDADMIRLELQRARAASKLRYAMPWWEMETKNKGYVKGRYYYEKDRSRDNLVKKLYGPGHTYQRTPYHWEEGYDSRYVGQIVGPDGDVVDQITYHGPVF